MERRFRARALAFLLTLCQPLALVGVSPVLAQEGSDIEAPRIAFEPLEEGRLGDTQVFSARIRDDVGVESATLYYRLSPEAPYEAVAMEAIGGTDVHLASLEGLGEDATMIQYYLEARDAAGNRGYEGFAFDPFERRLVAGGTPASSAAVPAVAESPPPAESGMSTGRKVLYGVLGLIAVGALVAAADSGGGSDSGGSPLDDPGTEVPVDLIVDPLR